MEEGMEEDMDRVWATFQAALAVQSFNGLQLLPRSQENEVPIEDNRDEYAGMYS
jgi:hypothetical protein